MKKLYVALVLMVLSPTLASALPASQEDTLAIRALFAANDAAWNAGDAAALTRLYTADGTARLGYSGDPITGRDALTRFFGQALSGAPGSRHVTRPDHIQMVAPDVALVDAHVVLERPSQGGTWQPVQVLRSNAVAVREGGRWKLHSLRAHPQPSDRTSTN